MSLKSAHTSLAGKLILVTGGTTGIGRATVKMLAGQGARVLTCGRNEPELADSLENARGSLDEVSALTRSAGTDVVTLRVEPRVQTTS